MKSHFTTVFLVLSVLLLSISLIVKPKNSLTSSNDELSKEYTGPIIDMHIHVFSDGHPMFGMTHPPTLRKETYEGAGSADELKKKTLEKFKEHNIVKAVATDGQLWFDDAPEIIMIGRLVVELIS